MWNGYGPLAVACENDNESLDSIKHGNFLKYATFGFSGRNLLHGVGQYRSQHAIRILRLEWGRNVKKKYEINV